MGRDLRRRRRRRRDDRPARPPRRDPLPQGRQLPPEGPRPRPRPKAHHPRHLSARRAARSARRYAPRSTRSRRSPNPRQFERGSCGFRRFTAVSRRRTAAAANRPNPAQRCGKRLRIAKGRAHSCEARLCGRPDFKTGAFNRSATLPRSIKAIGLPGAAPDRVRRRVPGGVRRVVDMRAAQQVRAGGDGALRRRSRA
jgi:hypothetical protein